MFTRVAKAMGFDLWSIAQFRHFAEEIRAGAYAVGAPTDHIEHVCGRPAEDFEVTAQRYLENPDRIWPGFSGGGRLATARLMLNVVLTRAPKLDAFEATRARPRLVDPLLAHESDEWLATAQRRDLNLLDVVSRTNGVTVGRPLNESASRLGQLAGQH